MPASLIDFHQMVDLALATPVMGAVNIPVLHSLLHCLVHKLSMSSHRVEFDGANNHYTEDLISSIPHPSPVNLKEFSVANSEAPHIRKDVSLPLQDSPIKTIITINTTSLPHAKHPAGLPIAPIHIMSTTDLEILKNRVASIHDALASILPADEQLLDPDDENCSTSQLARMNRIINTAKRVDAVEIGLRKMAEMVTFLASTCDKSRGRGARSSSSGESISSRSESIMSDKDPFPTVTNYDQISIPEKHSTENTSDRRRTEKHSTENTSDRRKTEKHSIENTPDRRTTEKHSIESTSDRRQTEKHSSSKTDNDNNSERKSSSHSNREFSNKDSDGNIIKSTHSGLEKDADGSQRKSSRRQTKDDESKTGNKGKTDHRETRKEHKQNREKKVENNKTKEPDNPYDSPEQFDDGFSIKESRPEHLEDHSSKHHNKERGSKKDKSGGHSKHSISNSDHHKDTTGKGSKNEYLPESDDDDYIRPTKGKVPRKEVSPRNDDDDHSKQSTKEKGSKKELSRKIDDDDHIKQRTKEKLSKKQHHSESEDDDYVRSPTKGKGSKKQHHSESEEDDYIRPPTKRKGSKKQLHSKSDEDDYIKPPTKGKGSKKQLHSKSDEDEYIKPSAKGKGSKKPLVEDSYFKPPSMGKRPKKLLPSESEVDDYFGPHAKGRGSNSDYMNEILDLVDTLTKQLSEVQATGDSNYSELSIRLNNYEKTLSGLLEATEEEFRCILNKHHNQFLQTMIEVQDMFDVKVDKSSIPGLKQFLVDHLNEFRGALEYFRREFGMIPDASATTVRKLRMVDCLSCSQRVFQADREHPPYVPLTNGATPVNRFCGGSHTTTTPVERRLVKGNFIAQYGGIGNKDVELEIGTDGGFYRVKEGCPCGKSKEAPKQ